MQMPMKDLETSTWLYLSEIRKKGEKRKHWITIMNKLVNGKLTACNLLNKIINHG